ncbi:helix-turn-helix domain-containing protein [Streptomyces sp. NPDC001933]|uniref:helix-turn-helix domain-containing protein n=1 Tax=Streptomyces sp. NPDC001933 TaxID=3364626 RepID=UPI0036C69C51
MPPVPTAPLDCHRDESRVAALFGGLADYPPGAAFGPRRLVDWELVWVLSGGAEWQRGPVRIELAPGRLLLLPPGSPDVFDWSRHGPTRHGYLHFRITDPDLAARIGPQPLLRELTDRDPQRALAQYLLALIPGSGPPEWPEQAARVLELLLEIMLDGPLPGGAEDLRLPAPVLDAAEAVAAQWCRDGRPGVVRLERLAAAAGLSERQLGRVFRQRLGEGPVKAFEVVRLSRVAELLARSNLTLAAVARSCGYASPYHLSRRFRAEYGVSPREYRVSAGGQDIDGSGGSFLRPDPVARRGLTALARVVAQAEDRQRGGMAGPGDP